MEKDFTLSSPVQIARIIQSLRDDHQLIGVSFRDRNEGSQSIIVDVDLDAGFFSVDELPSAGCRQLVSDGEPFDIRAELNGVDVGMAGLKVSEISEDDQGALYQVPIPKRISYVQRREAFRARVTGLTEVPVALSWTDEETSTSGELEAALDDISADGCRLAVSARDDVAIGQTPLPISLRIDIPDSELPICVDACTRHARYLARSKLWYVGCEFEQRDASTQQMIERFVIYIQRLQRQREARLLD